MASGNWLNDLLALFTSVAREHAAPGIVEGPVTSGSWNATEGTVQHLDGSTAAILPGDTDGDQSLAVDGYPVLTTQIGDQYAPRGGEEAVAIPVPSGRVVMFRHTPDNSPKVPAGERWVYHFNSSSAVDSFWKHTNDGPTTGDGLGGAQYGGNAALSQLTTKSGHAVKLNDTAKTVTVASHAGWTFVLDDTNNLATITAPGGTLVQITNTGKVYLGANGLASGNAVMTQEDVVNALTALATNIKTWGAANFQAGASTPATGPTVPTVTGSSTVFAKE